MDIYREYIDENNTLELYRKKQGDKFIGCILKTNRLSWICNLELLNMYDAEKWLDTQNDDKKNNQTVLLPYNCMFTPNYIKKMVVNYKLNGLIHKYYVNIK